MTNYSFYWKNDYVVWAKILITDARFQSACRWAVIHIIKISTENEGHGETSVSIVSVSFVILATDVSNAQSSLGMTGSGHYMENCNADQITYKWTRAGLEATGNDKLLPQNVGGTPIARELKTCYDSLSCLWHECHVAGHSFKADIYKSFNLTSLLSEAHPLMILRRPDLNMWPHFDATPRVAKTIQEENEICCDSFIHACSLDSDQRKKSSRTWFLLENVKAQIWGHLVHIHTLLHCCKCTLCKMSVCHAIHLWTFHFSTNWSKLAHEFRVKGINLSSTFRGNDIFLHLIALPLCTFPRSEEASVRKSS